MAARNRTKEDKRQALNELKALLPRYAVDPAASRKKPASSYGMGLIGGFVTYYIRARGRWLSGLKPRAKDGDSRINHLPRPRAHCGLRD